MPGDYFLLDANTGWRALEPPEGLILDDPQGMHLCPLPGEPEAMVDPAGTLGGMDTPTGIVVDAEGRVYASDATRHCIWRLDPCTKTWKPLPCLGGEGSQPRQLKGPRGLALSPDGDLYVADSGNHRVQVFNLKGLVLRALWGKRARATEPVAGQEPGEFDRPWDAALDSQGNVYVADRGNRRVQKWDRRSGRFHVFDGTPLKVHFFLVLYGALALKRFIYIPARKRLEPWPLGSPGVSEEVTSEEAARLAVLRHINALGATDILHEWQGEYPPDVDKDEPFVAPTHLAIDGDDRLYVVDAEKDYVKVLDSQGRVMGRVSAPDELRGQFQPAAVAVDEGGHVLVADSQGRGIHRFRPRASRWDEVGRCPDSQEGCLGLTIAPAGDLLAAGGQGGGVIRMGQGAGFEMSGEYRSQALDSEIEGCRWHRIRQDFAAPIPTGTSVTAWTYTSEVERAQDEIANLPDDAWHTAQTNAEDFLIQSPPGRYLWLRVRFQGNGTHTPVLRGLKVCFPRRSSLQYLPAVYQEDVVSRELLDRFLSLFDTMFENIEHRVDDFARYLDPDGTPPEFLDWLGGWLALSLEGRWTPEQKRELIRRAPTLFRKRGTVEGLKEYLHVFTGCEAHILEHYTLRRWLFLDADGTLGRQSALWGHGIVRRLQLGEYSRIGDFRLVGTGDPERDPFHVFAHKFSVFIPAPCLDSEVKERTVRRLIEQEKPAHTRGFLCKLEPRFRVGVQSTVGIDTMVGGYPRLVLGTVSTLGSDALLGQAPELRGPAMTQVGQGRVGASTVVG